MAGSTANMIPIYWVENETLMYRVEEEKKGMATLKDLLTETYDIFVDGDKYFCVPKFGKIDQDFDYEMRDVAELDCEIGQVDGFRNNTMGMGDFASTDTIMTSTTSVWRPPVLEEGMQFKGSVFIGNQEVKRIESNNESADS